MAGIQLYHFVVLFIPNLIWNVKMNKTEKKNN